MNRLKNWFQNWRKQFKFAIYDPTSFDEIFGITTSKIRVASFLFIVLLFSTSILFFVISWTPLSGYFFSASQPIEQQEIIEQRIRIDSLSKKLDAQNQYIEDLRKILSGKPPTEEKHLNENKDVVINTHDINPKPSKAEEEISNEVKADQYTISDKKSNDLVHLMAPLKGHISQSYKANSHEAIDIVAPVGSYFATCLSGTVIYSGFSQKDGNILIIEHSNGFTSVYKHAKTNLKKRGDKVRTGDLIGIIGNTGTNSTGPHLHFELWLNQQPVNPANYILFAN